MDTGFPRKGEMWSGHMVQYSFWETLRYFSENLKAAPPEEDVEAGAVELVVDQLHIHISKGVMDGSLNMMIPLGLILQPMRESRLKELATGNYLGVNTGGCTLAFDESETTLQLNVNTTPTTSPQENWEWLHRLLHVATQWNKKLDSWEEFIPLASKRRES